MKCGCVVVIGISVDYGIGAPRVMSTKEFVISMTWGPLEREASTLEWWEALIKLIEPSSSPDESFDV